MFRTSRVGWKENEHGHKIFVPEMITYFAIARPIMISEFLARSSRTYDQWVFCPLLNVLHADRLRFSNSVEVNAPIK